MSMVARTDTLSLTSAGVAVIDGYDVSTANILNGNLSNVEVLTVSDSFNTGVDMDMGRLAGITSITLMTVLPETKVYRFGGKFNCYC